MASRGFSTLAAMVSVAALVSVLLTPQPLRRLHDAVAQAEYQDFSRAVSDVASEFSLSSLVHRLQPCLVHAADRPSPFSAPPSAESWRTLDRGIRYRAVHLTARSGESMLVHEIRIDPAVARIRFVYSQPATSVAAAAQKSRARAAVNACYFDTDRKPLGYLKIDGRIVNGGVASGAAFTGVFTLAGTRARIVPRNNFDGHVVDTAVQAGPRLVADGVPTGGLRETRSFRQSGVAVTRDGAVVMYATDSSYRGITWGEMQTLLTGPAAQGGINARDVLNFDGGSSSQIYVHLKGGDVETGFPTPVPVVMACLARS